MSCRWSLHLSGFLLVLLVSLNAVAQTPASATKQNGNANAHADVNAEEAAVFDRILNHVHFDNDGKELSETEAVIRIQSQAGVEEFGQLVF
jgi:hypothetical protein